MTPPRFFRPEAVHTLVGVEPTLPPDDLAVLGALVGSAKVVALGEPTHGQKEINQLRDRITRYLVEHEGFRVVAMEDSAITCRRVNDYVVHGVGTALRALQQQNFWTWRTKEVLAMIEWLREWNMANPADTVQFIGVDMQDFATPAAELSRILQDFDQTAERYYPLLLGTIGAIELRDTQSFTAERFAGYIQILGDLRRFIATTENLVFEDRELGLDCVNALEQALGLWKALADSPDEWSADQWNRRDEVMAARAMAPTLQGTKVILWAHNGHVESETGDHLPPGAVTTGTLLREYLALASVVISGVFGSGSYRGYDVGVGGMGVLDVGDPPEGSLDHELYVTSEAAALVINLRAPGSTVLTDQTTRWAGAELVPGEEMILGVRPALGSDAIAFVRRATPSEPI